MAIHEFHNPEYHHEIHRTRTRYDSKINKLCYGVVLIENRPMNYQTPKRYSLPITQTFPPHAHSSNSLIVLTDEFNSYMVGRTRDQRPTVIMFSLLNHQSSRLLVPRS